MYPDFRSQRRFQCHARFVAAGNSSQPLLGEIQDVSSFGLCLTTSAALPRGRELHLEFELPTGLVKVVGEVRWSATRKDGRLEHGLRFVRISAPSMAAIADAMVIRPFRSRVMQDYVFR